MSTVLEVQKTRQGLKVRTRRTLLRIEANSTGTETPIYAVGTMVTGSDRLGYHRAAWHYTHEGLNEKEALDAAVQVAAVLAAAIGVTPGFFFFGVDTTMQTVFYHAVDAAVSK